MLPSEILTKIPTSYEQALSTSELFFYPSTLHRHLERNVNYEVRLCPALQKKPPLPAPILDAVIPAKQDPFAPPYNSSLLVGYLSTPDSDNEYVILLNKFCVAPHHFLMVTRGSASPLLPEDLLQTYSILAAARKIHKNLFAFYNCGDLSGCSQPHKHVQFIFYEDDEGPPIETLARSVNLETPGKPFSLTGLSYANHVYRLPSHFHNSPPEIMEQVLSEAFLSLLDLVVSTVRHCPDYPSGKPSFNVVLTLEHMHLIPRRQEHYTLADTEDEVSVNSLAFAGMFLVKSERELEAVKREGIATILRGVGLESVHDIQVKELSSEGDDANSGVA